jgi:hypothetical protein
MPWQSEWLRPRLGVVLIMTGEVALADLLYQSCGFFSGGDQPGNEQGASHGQQQGNSTHRHHADHGFL